MELISAKYLLHEGTDEVLKASISDEFLPLINCLEVCHTTSPIHIHLSMSNWYCMFIGEQELIVHSQSDMIITAIFSKWVKITMCKSMAGSRRTELTLFDCVKHTQEQEEEE